MLWPCVLLKQLGVLWRSPPQPQIVLWLSLTLQLSSKQAKRFQTNTIQCHGLKSHEYRSRQFIRKLKNVIIFIFFGYHFTCVTYIQFKVINESTFLHIYFKWGIFMAFEPELAKQLKIVCICDCHTL